MTIASEATGKSDQSAAQTAVSGALSASKGKQSDRERLTTGNERLERPKATVPKKPTFIFFKTAGVWG